MEAAQEHLTKSKVAASDAQINMGVQRRHAAKLEAQMLAIAQEKEQALAELKQQALDAQAASGEPPAHTCCRWTGHNFAGQDSDGPCEQRA